jgi:hypothetical protein
MGRERDEGGVEAEWVVGENSAIWEPSWEISRVSEIWKVQKKKKKEYQGERGCWGLRKRESMCIDIRSGKDKAKSKHVVDCTFDSPCHLSNTPVELFRRS